MTFTPAQYSQLIQLLRKKKEEEAHTENKSAHVTGKICLLLANSTWIMDSR